MEIIREGKPLITPTAEATCPTCEAVLGYTRKDVDLPKDMWYPVETEEDVAEIDMRMKASPDCWDVRMWNWFRENWPRDFQKGAIVCPNCRTRIETGHTPGVPHY